VSAKHGQAHTKVDFIGSMGSDQRVVDAARVSFNFDNKEWNAEKDPGLISFLARNKHWSPFSHCFATFKIKAPVFVSRQLVKHQVGLAWNEVSRRYVDSDVEFYFPDEWRSRPVDKKQGSGAVLDDDSSVYDYVYMDTIRHCDSSYRYLINKGVAPEQARAVLPLSMMTEWFWSGSMYAFARVCRLRLAEDSQLETRLVADSIDKHMVEIFPVSWKALSDEKNSID
jgi:thymidylate synthase (FAD)